jgi:hypothetical protein
MRVRDTDRPRRIPYIAVTCVCAGQCNGEDPYSQSHLQSVKYGELMPERGVKGENQSNISNFDEIVGDYCILYSCLAIYGL